MIGNVAFCYVPFYGVCCYFQTDMYLQAIGVGFQMSLQSIAHCDGVVMYTVCPYCLRLR